MVSELWRSFRYFDWFSFILICTLSMVGILFIFSATYTAEQPYSIFFKKQLLGFCTGIFVYFACCLVDHRLLMRWGHSLYWGIIALLCFTLVKGSIGMGGQRWLNLVFFKFQPSELAKPFFPAFFADYFFNKKNNFISTFTFIPTIATLVISFLLIAKQPDLGTGLIVFFSGIIMLWFAGINRKIFLYCLLACTLSAPILWQVLKPYQKKRILVFMGEGDKNKERYQIEQAAIAIGSGGLTGKGFLQGTQNKLHFLPESRTDFIFAVACEECGFIGALIILLLFLLLFLRIKNSIHDIGDKHMQLLATGLLAPIILSVLINVGMVINMLPVVGIPLPLMSYGISNLWVTLASLGWLQSIAMRERT